MVELSDLVPGDLLARDREGGYPTYGRVHLVSALCLNRDGGYLWAWITWSDGDHQKGIISVPSYWRLVARMGDALG